MLSDDEYGWKLMKLDEIPDGWKPLPSHSNSPFLLGIFFILGGSKITFVCT